MSKTTSKLFDVTLRRKNETRRAASDPNYSPLLIIQSCARNRTELGRNSCAFEDDILEIKDLCQSPRSNRTNRFSMFRFSPNNSPSPGNSPTLSHKELSDDSSLSQESVPSPSPPAVSTTIAERKRYMVISEITSTEAKYVKNLNAILSFLGPLETVVSGRSLRQLIPAQLEQLLESHEEILANLKSCGSRDEFNCENSVGQIFSKLCSPSNVEFFNMYRVYMGEFKIAMKTLATYEAESREFKEVLTMLHQSPMCEKLSLASHLLTPIQRLPRYELLLKELLKYTPVGHPDNLIVEEALGRLHKELMKLNQSIKACQMVCSANTRSSTRVKFNQSNKSKKSPRKARRTLSMLKRFVSTTNIDDYSSGESTMPEDLLRIPRHYRRRNALAISSASINDSEVDLTGSIEMSANAPATVSLTKMGDDNRAVSCSDLRLEFGGKHRHSQAFTTLPPVPSESCTPSSITSGRHPTRNFSLPEKNEFNFEFRSSLVYSSNSSLSSVERGSPRCESLTPTEASFRALQGAVFSTPVQKKNVDGASPMDRKDVTLRRDSAPTMRLSSHSTGEEPSEEEEDENDTVPADIFLEDSVGSKKETWRYRMGRKLKLKKSKNELKYAKRSCSES